MDGYRWDQWGVVMTATDSLRTRSGKAWRLFLQLLPAGIPAPLRGKVWQELCGAAADAVDSAHSAASGYSYVQLIAQRSVAEELILKDVPRTLPQHPCFAERVDRGGHGQAALFNVAKAFSLVDEEVGYCQGITSLSAILLLANAMDEEAAFSTLCKLMSAQLYGPLRRQFVPEMPMLQLHMWQLERLLHRHLPLFNSHLLSLGVLPTTFASEWFLTLFAQGDWPTVWVARVWDLFLVHGISAIFAIALAICSAAESQCCATEEASAHGVRSHARGKVASGGDGVQGSGTGRSICTRRWDFDRTVTLLKHGIASQCCTEQHRQRSSLLQSDGIESQPHDAAHTGQSTGAFEAKPSSSGSEPAGSDSNISATGLQLLSSGSAWLPSLGGQKALAKLEKQYASTVGVPAQSQRPVHAQLQAGDSSCTSTAMRQRAAAASVLPAAHANATEEARPTYTYTCSHQGIAAAMVAVTCTGRDGNGTGSGCGYPGAKTVQETATATAAVRRRIVQVKRELARSERQKQQLVLEITDVQAEILELQSQMLPTLRCQLGALKSHDMDPAMQLAPGRELAPPTPPRPC